jgi:hypothetical protein
MPVLLCNILRCLECVFLLCAVQDYTGQDVTVSNFFAAILGDKSGIEGGSGKVVDSGPNDHIFIYYTDHGGPGVLGMPTMHNLYAVDFVETLKKKHESGTYREMVIYVEACESGSIFEGLLRTADYKERSSPSQNAIALALALFLSLSLSPSCLSGSAAACAPPSSSCSILRESNRRSDDKVSPCFLFLFLLSNFWK